MERVNMDKNIEKNLFEGVEKSMYNLMESVNITLGESMKLLEKMIFIATIRHATWVGYQIANNLEYNEVPSKEQLTSLIQATANQLLKPDLTPERNHNNWWRYKEAQGWKWGPKKDTDKKEHPDMICYEDLPEVERKKDELDIIAHNMALKMWKDQHGD